MFPTPVTAVLLSVPGHRAGTASGVYNASRQVGGALAVAVFGALLADQATLTRGLRASLLLAAPVTLATAATSLLIKPPAGLRPPAVDAGFRPGEAGSVIARVSNTPAARRARR